MAQKAQSSKDDQLFSQLVEGLVTKTQADTKCESSDILRDVIRSHIYTWLDKFEDINSLFKVSELISVGSYAEGTKIIQPDEFDYLAVIEDFSKPDVVRIDANERDIQNGLVKVVVEDEELKSRCSGLCKDGHLKCFQPINFPGLTDQRFGHIFIKILWTFVRCSRRLGPTTGSPTDIDCKVLLPTVNNVSLYFKGADFKAPNVLVKFEYKTIEVTVDVSPAIRYHNIHDCFREKDCAGPAFAELVLSRQSILLVGTLDESDFKVTVTEAEVEYLQRVMKPEHKIIYIFLKYIVKLYNDNAGIFIIFTSYMMKTICIHHDINCKKDKRSIKECFNSMIKDMNDCAQQGYIVSIVNKHRYIRKTLYTEEEREFAAETILQDMRAISQMPTDIETVEAFEIFLKEFTYNVWMKRCNAEQERLKRVMELEKSIRAERIEWVSELADMGFEPREVKRALESALYDFELAKRILLQRRAKMSIEQKDKVNYSCSTSHKVNPPGSHIYYDKNEWFKHGYFEERERDLAF